MTDEIGPFDPGPFIHELRRKIEEQLFEKQSEDGDIIIKEEFVTSVTYELAIGVYSLMYKYLDENYKRAKDGKR